MRSLGLAGVLLAVAGCALEGGSPVDDVGASAEAVLGAPCSQDAECAGWEYCDRPLCLPGRECGQLGICRDQTRFFDDRSTSIPDGDPRGVVRTLTVSRPNATVASVVVDVVIRHPYRGDLEVVLRAPSGVEIVLANRTGGAADDLVLSREVPELVGQPASGDWQLFVRDRARRDRGRLVGFGLAFTYAESCVDGETRYDGCNHCVCMGGGWACTKRYCPPVAQLGEVCDANIACVEGAVCDRGPAAEVACGVDRPGRCITTAPTFCRAPYAPVCTCDGQTFPNECTRNGHGAWAHDGRCELALAIPDGDPSGVRHTVRVGAPAGATRAQVSVEIVHPYRGDLTVWIEGPDGSRHVLTDRAGGAADDFAFDGTIEAMSALGDWTLVAIDRARRDRGELRFVNVVAERP